MYRNMQKIDKILYNLDCLICDNNKNLRDLIYINSESHYNKDYKEVVIKLSDKTITVKNGILIKLNEFYDMLTILENGDFESDLQMLDCFLRNHEFKFDYQDLSDEIKDIIPIRKECGIYNKEDEEGAYYVFGGFKKKAKKRKNAQPLTDEKILRYMRIGCMKWVW